MKLLRHLAVVVAVFVGTALASPAADAEPTVGAGALATIASIAYPLQVYYHDPITIGDVRLQGGTLADSGGQAAVVVADAHIGPFSGWAWNLCQMTRHCGYRGINVDFDGSPVAVTGQTVDGLPINGTCHGGSMAFGFSSGPAFHTECTVSVGPQTYGPFALDIESIVPSGADFIGPWCAHPVGLPSCAQAVVVDNPLPGFP
jgi:hypothetical protein